MNRKDFYSSTEAASIMMCTASHVRHLIKLKKLPSYYVGNRAFVPKVAIENYISKKTITVDCELSEANKSTSE